MVLISSISLTILVCSSSLFSGCTFGAKAISSMNLGGLVDYTDSFTGKKMTDFKLQPSCSALFVRSSSAPDPHPSQSSPVGNGQTEAGATSASYNFQLDVEIKISGTSPQVFVKSATFVK